MLSKNNLGRFEEWWKIMVIKLLITTNKHIKRMFYLRNS